jgi:hypothetical protein
VLCQNIFSRWPRNTVGRSNPGFVPAYGIDVVDAYNHFMAAAQALDVGSQARADVLDMATKQSGAAFSGILNPPVRA